MSRADRFDVRVSAGDVTAVYSHLQDSGRGVFAEAPAPMDE
jgi:hypothetical protein